MSVTSQIRQMFRWDQRETGLMFPCPTDPDDLSGVDLAGLTISAGGDG